MTGHVTREVELRNKARWRNQNGKHAQFYTSTFMHEFYCLETVFT